MAAYADIQRVYSCLGASDSLTSIFIAEHTHSFSMEDVAEIATFFCRVSGRSMEPHMRDGDILMVDKSIEPKAGKVVIAAINGEMTVKRLSVVDGQMTLTADNPNYPDMKVGDFDESMIWGVVTNVIHQL